MTNGAAQDLSDNLTRIGFHSTSTTEKDKRIEDLKNEIKFLQNVIYFKLGVKDGDIEKLRKLRE
jgi:hypothetical protein